MKNRTIRFPRQFDYWAALFGCTATVAFAQTSSFGQAAQRIAKKATIAKWVWHHSLHNLGHRPVGGWTWHRRHSTDSFHSEVNR